MHLLDLLMYFVCLFLLLKILDLIGGGDLTEGLGGVTIGFPITILFTIGYIVMFVYPIDLNWIDIFKQFNFTYNFTW